MQRDKICFWNCRFERWGYLGKTVFVPDPLGHLITINQFPRGLETNDLRDLCRPVQYKDITTGVDLQVPCANDRASDIDRP